MHNGERVSVRRPIGPPDVVKDAPGRPARDWYLGKGAQRRAEGEQRRAYDHRHRPVSRDRGEVVPREPDCARRQGARPGFEDPGWLVLPERSVEDRLAVGSEAGVVDLAVLKRDPLVEGVGCGATRPDLPDRAEGEPDGGRDSDEDDC